MKLLGSSQYQYVDVKVRGVETPLRLDGEAGYRLQRHLARKDIGKHVNLVVGDVEHTVAVADISLVTPVVKGEIDVRKYNKQ